MLASVWGTVVATYRFLVDAILRLIRLNRGLQDELQPARGSLRWLNLCLILLTIASTALAFQEGLRQKMHRVAPDSIDMLAQISAIAISQRLHGTSGYVGRAEVLDTLYHGGFTAIQKHLDELGIKYPENAEMPDRINRAIQDAVALKDLPADATFANKRLFALRDPNDPGFVDYVRWSFEIFGYRVEAYYYFYFLILSVSIALFLICFHADTLPLVVLSAVMVSFLLLLNSQLFTSVNIRTVHNQRFLGSLSLVPYLHLLFAFLLYRKPTLSRLLPTILQAAVFSFAIFTRSSTFWMFLSFAAIVGLFALSRFARREQEPKITRAANLVFSWPGVLVVGALLCPVAYKSATLHPIYSIGVFLPYHMVWHNAYMGLGLHPDWVERGDKHNGKPIPDALSDNMAWMGAVAEAEEYYGLSEGNLNNYDIGGYPAPKMALHEKLIRDRFLRFVLGHPRFTLELYLWYKPKMFVTQFFWVYGTHRWNAESLFGLAAFIAMAVLAWRQLVVPPQARKMLSAALLITGVMSFMPIMWTYPIHHVAGEQFLIWVAILLYFAAFWLSKAWAMTRSAARQPA